MAQSLEDHLWQDRVVLLLATDSNDTTLQKQLSIFKENLDGIKERKLVIYQITNETLKKDGIDLFDEKFKVSILKNFQSDNNAFTFVLIGLDGGEKMRSNKEVTLGKLFGEIDQMPMRRRNTKERF